MSDGNESVVRIASSSVATDGNQTAITAGRQTSVSSDGADARVAISPSATPAATGGGELVVNTSGGNVQTNTAGGNVQVDD